MQDSFNSSDKKRVEEIASSTIIKSTVLFERYDGSGIRKMNSREMSDLEIVFVAINRSFGFGNEESANVLSKIQDGDFVCISKILIMLKRILYKEPLTPIRVTG